MIRRPPKSTLFPSTPLFRSLIEAMGPLPRTHGLLGAMLESPEPYRIDDIHDDPRFRGWWPAAHPDMRSFLDRKSTRLNSSHANISYAVFCLKKKKKHTNREV